MVSLKVPKICEGKVDGLLTCVLVDVIVECITVEVETPTDTTDTEGDIYEDYDSYSYSERGMVNKIEAGRLKHSVSQAILPMNCHDYD